MEVVQARMSRRAVLTGSMVAAAGFMTSRLVADVPSAYAAPTRPRSRAGGLLGYTAVPLSKGDEIVVPKGYSARAFVPWGTPILGEPAGVLPGTPRRPGFTGPGGNTAAQQAQQMGMHHDGMHFFPFGKQPRGSKDKRASDRGVLVVNHEYTDEAYLHTGRVQSGYTDRRAGQLDREMVRKSQAAHGVSVVEVRRTAAGQWRCVAGLNRRITRPTPMAFSARPRATGCVRTSADPGQDPRGT
jgi:secreted PhoX family phosphatase